MNQTDHDAMVIVDAYGHMDPRTTARPVTLGEYEDEKAEEAKKDETGS